MFRALKTSVLFPVWPCEPFNPWWSHLQKGLWAERVVARRLWQDGHRIIAHRHAGPERTDIDLIAANRERLIFAEVKYRTAVGEDPWAATADPERIRRLLNAISDYLRATRQLAVAISVNGYLVSAPDGAANPKIICWKGYVNASQVPGWRGLEEEWSHPGPAPL
ncbi:hypothetical protein BH09SUM1_BH09SUM1_17370 [soil metagenome]